VRTRLRDACHEEPVVEPRSPPRTVETSAPDFGPPRRTTSVPDPRVHDRADAHQARLIVAQLRR
jgi:hypothetical protein